MSKIVYFVFLGLVLLCIVIGATYLIYQNYLISGKLSIAQNSLSVANGYSISGTIGNNKVSIGNSQLMREILEEMNFFDPNTAHSISNAVKPGGTVNKINVVFSQNAQARPLIVSGKDNRIRSSFSVSNDEAGIYTAFINISDINEDLDRNEKFAQLNIIAVLHLIRHGFDEIDPTGRAVDYASSKSEEIANTNQQRIILLQ